MVARKSFNQEYGDDDSKKNTNSNLSLAKFLLDEQVIDLNFIDTIANIKLEDLIALKLEVSNNKFDNRIYGLPLVNSMYYIVLDSVSKYAVSCTRTSRAAASVVGVSLSSWVKLTQLLKLFPRMKPGYIFLKDPEINDEKKS